MITMPIIATLAAIIVRRVGRSPVTRKLMPAATKGKVA